MLSKCAWFGNISEKRLHDSQMSFITKPTDYHIFVKFAICLCLYSNKSIYLILYSCEDWYLYNVRTVHVWKNLDTYLAKDRQLITDVSTCTLTFLFMISLITFVFCWKDLNICFNNWNDWILTVHALLNHILSHFYSKLQPYKQNCLFSNHRICTRFLVVSTGSELDLQLVSQNLIMYQKRCCFGHCQNKTKLSSLYNLTAQMEQAQDKRPLKKYF